MGISDYESCVENHPMSNPVACHSPFGAGVNGSKPLNLKRKTLKALVYGKKSIFGEHERHLRLCYLLPIRWT